MPDSPESQLPSVAAVSTSISRKADLSEGLIRQLMDKSKTLSLIWWPGAFLSLLVSSWGVFIWRGYWPWEPPPGGIEGVFVDAVISMLVIGGVCGGVVGGLYGLSRKLLVGHARELGLEEGFARKVVARMASAPKPKLGTTPEEAMLQHLGRDQDLP